MAEPGADREFEPFVRVHSMALLRTAFLLTGDVHEAEDLLQATLSDLFAKWRRVAQAESPLAYVRRSMVNRLTSSRRKRGGNEITLWDIPDRWTTADLADQVAVRRDLWVMLSALPDRQRSAVVLRYFHDLSDDEIAGALGCRPGTVRSLLSRALASLNSAPSGSLATKESRWDQ